VPHLKRLKLLDLSFNKINKIDEKELPLSLVFLDLRNNQISDNEMKLIEVKLEEYLPNLKQLNMENLFDPNNEIIKEKYFKFDEQVDTIDNLSDRICKRSKQRQLNDEKEERNFKRQQIIDANNEISLKIQQMQQDFDNKLKFITET
jgi:Leucine-rich repeat (LRR) protein